jgi:hypothetical protein
MTYVPVAKGQAEIVEHEKHLTTLELLDEVLVLAPGDKYDGEFTAKGKWKYDYLLEKLRWRINERL